MNVQLDSIKDIFQEDEEIIFQKKQSVYIQEVRRMDLREIEGANLFISNLANIYIYSESSGTCFYFKQGETVRRFRFNIEENIVVIKIKNLMFKCKSKNPLSSFGKFSLDINMTQEEFEKVNSRLKVLLFKSEEEIEEEKRVETGFLVAHNLFKLYGNNKEENAALKGIDISIGEGEFLCIMGPSGSGKSTLINLLSTIDKPTRGTVKFNGENLWLMSERAIAKFRYKNLGFIFQNFNLIDNLTVKENISVPLILASKSREEIEDKVNRIAEKLYIKDLLNKYPGECSGGENQRMACARALVTEPKIIVADEPTGNLDTKNSHELLKMLQELNKEGTTIVMVTHDNMIASYSQRLIFIRDGRVDNILERGNLSQKEYFYKIIEITSKESQNLIDIL